MVTVKPDADSNESTPLSTINNETLLPARLTRTPVMLALLVLVTLLVFLPQLTGDFDFTNWDDNWLITSNHHIRSFSGENLATILDPTIPVATREELGNEYLPVRDLSYSLNYALGGYEPWGYHALNWLLHLFNVLLVFSITRRLSASKGIALGAALLFATLPIHVEVVTWLSSRKDLLATFFVLLSMREYLRFRRGWGVRKGSRAKDSSLVHRAPDASRDAESRASRAGLRVWLPYAFSIICFMLAMLSKVPAIVLPGLLVVLEVWGIRKSARLNLRSLAILIAPFAVVCLGFFAIALPLAQNGLIREYFGNSFTASALTSTAAFGEYFLSFLFGAPAGAAVDFPVKESVDAGVLASLIVILGLSALALVGGWRAWAAGAKGENPLDLSTKGKSDDARKGLTLRRALFGFAMGMTLAFTAFVPVSNAIFVTGTAYADRYAYLPSIGWCIGFAYLATWSLRWLAARLPEGAVRRVVPLVIATLVIGWYGVKANIETYAWKNSFTLWQSVLDADPANHLAHFNIARARHEKALGEPDRALARKQLELSAESYRQALANPARTYRFDPARTHGALAQVQISMVHQDKGSALERLNELLPLLRSYTLDAAALEVRADAGRALTLCEGVRAGLNAPELHLEERKVLALIDQLLLADQAQDEELEDAWRKSLADEIELLLPGFNPLGETIRWSPPVDRTMRRLVSTLRDEAEEGDLLDPTQFRGFAEALEERATHAQLTGWQAQINEALERMDDALRIATGEDNTKLEAMRLTLAQAGMDLKMLEVHARAVHENVEKAEGLVLLPWRNPTVNDRDFDLIRAILAHTLAQCNAAMGRHLEAIRQAEYALELSPREPSAYLNLAAELAARAAWRMDVLATNSVAQSRGKEAVRAQLQEEFAQALDLVKKYEAQLDRRDPGSLTTLAKLKARQAELIEDSAGRSTDEARALYAEAAHAYGLAIEQLRSAEASAGEIYANLMLQAEILQRDDDTQKESIALLDRAIKLAPDRPEAPTIRAKLLLREGTKKGQEEGLKALQSILRMHPDYQPAREDLSAILVALASDSWSRLRKDFGREYRAEMEAKGEDVPAEIADFLLLSYYLPTHGGFAKQGDEIKKRFIEALSLTEAKSASAKVGAAFLTELGLALANLNDIHGAEKLLIEALKYDDVNEDAANTLAAIYLNQLELAVKDWIQAIEIGSDEEVEARRAYMHSMIQGLILASEKAAKYFATSLVKLSNQSKITVAEEYKRAMIEITDGRDPAEYTSVWTGEEFAAKGGIYEFSDPQERSDYFFDLSDEQRQKIEEQKARRKHLMGRVADLYSMAWMVDASNTEALQQLKDYYKATGQFEKAIQTYDRLEKSDLISGDAKFLRAIRNNRAFLLVEWGYAELEKYRAFTRREGFNPDQVDKLDEATKLREKAFEIFKRAAAAHEVAVEFAAMVPARELLMSWSACFQVMANLDLSNAEAHLKRAVEVLEIRPDVFGEELSAMRERMTFHLNDPNLKIAELNKAIAQIDDDIQRYTDSDELGDSKEKVIERKRNERARLVDRVESIRSQMLMDQAEAELELQHPNNALNLLAGAKIRSGRWHTLRGKALLSLGREQEGAESLMKAPRITESQMLAAEVFFKLGSDENLRKTAICLRMAEYLMLDEIRSAYKVEDRQRMGKLLQIITERRKPLEERSGELLREGINLNSESKLRLAIDLSQENYMARLELASVLVDRAKLKFEQADKELANAQSMSGEEAKQYKQLAELISKDAMNTRNEGISEGMKAVTDREGLRYGAIIALTQLIFDEALWPRLGESRQANSLVTAGGLFAFYLRDLRLARAAAGDDAQRLAELDKIDAELDPMRERFIALGGDPKKTREQPADKDE